MTAPSFFRWLWQHRARVLVMLLYFFLGGTAGSILYAGLFNGNSTLITVILGAVAGVLSAVVWIWQMRVAETGHRQRARRLAWALAKIFPLPPRKKSFYDSIIAERRSS